jgi:replicative DNA helicase
MTPKMLSLAENGQSGVTVAEQGLLRRSPDTQGGSPLLLPARRTTLPHSVEAEMGVLGSMLTDARSYIPLAQQRVGPEHFYVPAHAAIFTSLLSMFENEGAIDLITFTQHLRDVGQLDSVGGPPFVTELLTFVPTAANIDHYLDIVRDKYA